MPLNYAKTGLLLAVLMGIFLLMGSVIGGQTGLVVAFVLALGMNAFSLWKSDKIVLRMHGAQEVDERSAPDYYGLVRELARRAELPMPKVYVMHNPQPNAFATGRSPASSAVCASTGLLEMLSREELAGVMAHELAHIKNRDTLTMTMAATIGGAISMVAQWMQFSVLFGRGGGREGGNRLLQFVAMLLAPFAAMIVQMAISRSREYQADRLGAVICGNPIWLASALHKIHNFARQIRNPSAEAVPATAHLFIINPLSGRGFDNWFSTHPSTENRIVELQKLAAEMGVSGGAPAADVATAERPSILRPSRRTSDNRGPWG
ncbi:MAG TPA: zinc metalloprotease HtpX [Hyphomicrobiaceae bacterium]|nr:zinc metalloprotease HtpX [Hyphomicrobiaceae bacterium]